MSKNALLTPAEILAMVPQQAPFRFIDEILEIDENHAVGRYTFRENESFYAGHFPGNPVTPGAILFETMGQAGIVILGVYLKALEVSRAELKHWISIFTDGEIEIFDIVRPGEQVTSRAEKIFWRRNKLRTKVEMFRSDGKLVACSKISGLGIRNE